MLAAALPAAGGWVLSGSLCGWGDMFIPMFELVVFLWIPSGVRLTRLRERELRRYGDAIAPGAPMHEAHKTFMSWAAAYDDGGLEMRSRRLHETWLADLPCPVLRFTEPERTEVHLEHVLGWVGSRARLDDRPR